MLTGTANIRTNTVIKSDKIRENLEKRHVIAKSDNYEVRHLMRGKLVFAMLMEASKFDTHLLSKKSNFSTDGCCKKNNFITFIIFLF